MDSVISLCHSCGNPGDFYPSNPKRCKICYRISREKYRKTDKYIAWRACTRRSKLLNDHKVIRLMKDIPCTDCGFKFPYWQMEFDHIFGKKYDIGTMPGKYTTKLIIDEIEKCDVVCIGCHRTRSRNRKIVESKSINHLSKPYKLIAKRKNKVLVQEYKQRPCIDCGHEYEFWKMDLDHRPGVIKIKNISSMCSEVISITKLMDELAKCDVVCCYCHSNRTMQRNGLNEFN